MSERFDWTRISDDPNDRDAKRLAASIIAGLRRVHTDMDLTGWVQRAARGVRVLDIGVVSHAARYFDLENWRHAKIAQAAAYCLGIDILEELLQSLRERGYRVRCADATSELDLGERFDLVFIGDVIEHVENPAALLRFGARHLAEGGRMLVATPNPFSRKFVRQFMREGVVMVNLDHVAWFTPTQALELARRNGLSLDAYHLIKPMSRAELAFKRIGWRFVPVDYSFPDYLYEFSAPRASDTSPTVARG